MTRNQQKAESLPNIENLKHKTKRSNTGATIDLAEGVKPSVLIGECTPSIYFNRDVGTFLKDASEIILRLPQVKALTGLSRTAIYSLMNPASPYFDSSFPKHFKLNPAGASNSAVGWYRSEIQVWVLTRKAPGIAGNTILPQVANN